MATISVSQDLDSAARTAGEAMTINSNATLTINTDTRYHRNAPSRGKGSLGSFTMTDAGGGQVLIDGTNVRWLSYKDGTGPVPQWGTYISGATSLVSGQFLGAYQDLYRGPKSGNTIPPTGYIKLKSVKPTAFVSGENLLGISAKATNTDVTGWIEVVLDDGANITIGRAQTWKVRGKWFYLDNTNGVRGQIIQLPTCSGGRYTRYPGVWIESYYSSNSYEFWPAQNYGNTLASGWSGSAKGTDRRSKFVEMRDSGQIRIGAHNYKDYGFLPSTNSRVRIPNVLLVPCGTAARSSNSLPHATVASRPEFTTTNAGNIDISGALSTWYFNIVQPYSISIMNCATLDSMILQEIASSFTIKEFHLGNYLNTDVNAVSITSCLAGGSISNCKWGRTGSMGSADYGTYVSYSNDITFTDCHFQNRIFRTNAASYPFYALTCKGLRFINPVMVGNSLAFAECSDTYIENPRYADSFHSVSVATSAPVGAVRIGAGCVDTVISGGGWWPTVPSTMCEVHVDTAFLYTIAANNTRWYNAGNSTTPLKAGNTNMMLYALNDGGNSIDTKIQRIYFDNIATRFINEVNSSKGIILENCYFGYSRVDGTAVDSGFVPLDGVIKGGTYTSAYTGYTSVYGTIFYNYFVSATVGRVGFRFNEATSTYAAYVDTTGLTGASTFNSAGALYMYNAGDVVIYTWPYYIKGYTAFAASDATKGGGNTGNLSYEYQIDKNDGNGWNGSWKDATSANLAAESISATLGFKLKFRITCVTPGTNYLNSFYVTMDTTANDQLALYPLNEYTVTLTGLISGTRIAYLASGSETILEIETTPIETSSYTYSDTDVGSQVDIAILKEGYEYQKLKTILESSDYSIPVVMEDDLAYTTPTEDVIFSGQCHRIIGISGTTTINIQEGIYSAWIDWVVSSQNIKYKQALRTAGGDEISATKDLGITYFMMNDWRIRPAEGNYRLTLEGNIFTDPAGESVVVSTLDPHSVVVEMSVSNLVESTLAEMSEIEYASFNGGITIDVVSGTDSSTYPYGTTAYPCKTILNAAAIGAARGFTILYIIGDLTISSVDIPYYVGGTLIGQGIKNSTVTVDNTIVVNSVVKECTVEGTAGNGSNAVFHDCVIGNLNNISLDAHDCVLTGTIELNNSITTNFFNCTDGVPGSGTPVLEVNDCESLGIWNYRGGIKLTNIITPGTNVSFNAPSGRLIVDATDIEGSIIARGVGSVTGTTGGTTINQTDLINRDTISDSVWDESISDHMTGGTTGYLVSTASISGASAQQVWEYVTRTLTSATSDAWVSSQIRGISSQIHNISSQLPLGQWHGEGSWDTGLADLSSITPELDYISSQLHDKVIPDIEYISSQVGSISSQISGISLGGGATPAQIWSHADRTLTGDTDTVKWISSNLEPYGGGGGGGKAQYYAVYGRKSVWTYPQKDKLIKDVGDTLEKLKKFQKDEKDHYNEAQDKLEKVLKRVDSLIATLGELKITNKDMEKEVDKITKALKKQRDIVSTSSQINAAIGEINNLAKMVVTMMPDEKLEDVYKELGVIDGSGDSSERIEQAISGQK